jgi:hypothetical protein
MATSEQNSKAGMNVLTLGRLALTKKKFKKNDLTDASQTQII